MWICTHCGEKNLENTLVCSMCGEWHPTAPRPSEMSAGTPFSRLDEPPGQASSYVGSTAYGSAALPSDPEGRSARMLFAFLIVGLPFLVLAAIGLVPLQGNLRAQSEFHRAPGCTSTGIKDPSLPPCTIMTMDVVSMRSEYVGKGSTSYYVTLADSAGNPKEIQLLGHRLYDTLRVSDPVSATIWKGTACVLSAHGVTVSTSEHPDVNLESSESAAGAGLFGLILITVVSVLAVRYGKS